MGCVGKNIKGGAPCSIARTVDVIKDPWSFTIVREALSGVTRFADFRDSLGIASDILTERLATLVDSGILTREPYQEPGLRARYSYHLTEAGAELKIVLGALQQWGDEHLPWPEGPTVVRTGHRTGRPLHVAFVDDRGREVALADADMVRTAAYPS
jgi:DNA-binding HxlR family transcriptional regulator